MIQVRHGRRDRVFKHPGRRVRRFVLLIFVPSRLCFRLISARNRLKCLPEYDPSSSRLASAFDFRSHASSWAFA